MIIGTEILFETSFPVYDTQGVLRPRSSITTVQLLQIEIWCGPLMVCICGWWL